MRESFEIFFLECITFDVNYYVQGYKSIDCTIRHEFFSFFLFVVEWVTEETSYIIFFPYLFVFILHNCFRWFAIAVQTRLQFSLSNFDFCLLFAFCSIPINCWQLINYRNICCCFWFSALVGCNGMIRDDWYSISYNEYFADQCLPFVSNKNDVSITIFIVLYCIWVEVCNFNNTWNQNEKREKEQKNKN